MCVYPSLCRASSNSDIDTLSLHDALPICFRQEGRHETARRSARVMQIAAPQLQLRVVLILEAATAGRLSARSEEHTSELQSLRHLVCRLLLEKKKKKKNKYRQQHKSE